MIGKEYLNQCEKSIHSRAHQWYLTNWFEVGLRSETILLMSRQVLMFHRVFHALYRDQITMREAGAVEQSLGF